MTSNKIGVSFLLFSPLGRRQLPIFRNLGGGISVVYGQQRHSKPVFTIPHTIIICATRISPAIVPLSDIGDIGRRRCESSPASPCICHLAYWLSSPPVAASY